jgi:hypothetical protein
VPWRGDIGQWLQDKVCNDQVERRLFVTRGSLNNKRKAITNQVESGTSQGMSLEGKLKKVEHVYTVKHTSFTIKKLDNMQLVTQK